MTKIIASLRTAIESRRAYNRTIVAIERELAELDGGSDNRGASTHRHIDNAAR